MSDFGKDLLNLFIKYFVYTKHLVFDHDYVRQVIEQ